MRACERASEPEKLVLIDSFGPSCGILWPQGVWRCFFSSGLGVVEGKKERKGGEKRRKKEDGRKGGKNGGEGGSSAFFFFSFLFSFSRTARGLKTGGFVKGYSSPAGGFWMGKYPPFFLVVGFVWFGYIHAKKSTCSPSLQVRVEASADVIFHPNFDGRG